MAEAEVVPVRRLRIGLKDCQDYGYTVGCANCDHMQEHGCVKPGTQHSEVCRSRILTALAATPEGRARLSKVEARANRVLGDYVERRAEAASSSRPQMPLDGGVGDASPTAGGGGGREGRGLERRSFKEIDWV